MKVNSALLLGESIFTSMRTVAGEVPGLKMHLERVFNHCNEYFFNNRLSFEQFMHYYFSGQRLEKFIQRYPNHYIRLTFIPTHPMSPFSLGVCDIEMDLKAEVKLMEGSPINCQIVESPYSESFVPIKAGSYFQSLLAKKTVQKNGFDEAIYTTNGFLTEATTSNIVFQTGAGFVSPIYASALKGVSVRLFQEFCAKKSYEFNFRKVKTSELECLNGPMLLNSVHFLRPVARIGDKTYQTDSTDKLRKEFLNYLGMSL